MAIPLVYTKDAQTEGRLIRSGGGYCVYHETLRYETSEAPEFIDITNDVHGVVERSGIAFGTASIFSRHTTAAVKINEHEPLLLRDLARMLRHLAPQDEYYEHNDFSRRTVNMNPGECANGHSHAQQILLGSSETVPLMDARLVIGAWQSLFFIELDHPRPRQVLVTVMGIPREEA